MHSLISPLKNNKVMKVGFEIFGSANKGKTNVANLSLDGIVLGEVWVLPNTTTMVISTESFFSNKLIEVDLEDIVSIMLKRCSVSMNMNKEQLLVIHRHFPSDITAKLLGSLNG